MMVNGFGKRFRTHDTLARGDKGVASSFGWPLELGCKRGKGGKNAFGGTRIPTECLDSGGRRRFHPKRTVTIRSKSPSMGLVQVNGTLVVTYASWFSLVG